VLPVGVAIDQSGVREVLDPRTIVHGRAPLARTRVKDESAEPAVQAEDRVVSGPAQVTDVALSIVDTVPVGAFDGSRLPVEAFAQPGGLRVGGSRLPVHTLAGVRQADRRRRATEAGW
jgi:hypothetical protein